MKFKEALKIIEEENLNHIQVNDIAGKRLYDLSAANGAEASQKLQDKENVLSEFGRVSFRLANDKIKAASWRDAYQWPVTFHNSNGDPKPVQENNNRIGNIPMGYISQGEADLKAQLLGLQTQIEYDKKFVELEKKINDSKTKESAIERIFDKYFPMLGMVFDVDKDKLNNMYLLSQMGNAVKNPQTIAGPDKNVLQVQTDQTEAELEKGIQTNLENLAAKVGYPAILNFLQVLNDKPEFLQTLINMAKNFK